MKNKLLDRGIITLSGEIIKDNISYASTFCTPRIRFRLCSFAHYVM